MDNPVLDALHAVPPEAWLLLRVALILLLTWLTLRLIRRLGDRLSTKGVLSGRGEMTTRAIARVVVLLVATLFVLEQFGVSTAAVWAAASAVLVLVAVGFVAVWSVLSNALCSVLLLIYAPFRIGDEIDLVDTTNGYKLTGRVQDLNLLFVTLVETITDDTGAEDFTVQVPNNLFFQRAIRRRPGTRTQPLGSGYQIASGPPEAQDKPGKPGKPPLTGAPAEPPVQT